MNVKTFLRKEKTLVFMVSAMVTLFIVTSAIDANGQTFEPQRYQPDISEDQAIVCVQDVTDSEYRGQVYCKIFQADLDNNRSISDIQEELYKNPFEDTFEMGLVD